ncbi:unnamed protein product [Aphanomyces euteiches]
MDSTAWHGIAVDSSANVFANKTSESIFLKPIRGIGGRPRAFYKDIAYVVLNLSWFHVVVVLSFAYFGVIFAFALVFHYVCGESESLLDGYNLSYQAFSTIGFGIVYSTTRCGNYTTLAEAYVSMVLLPTFGGIIFTKFSLPKVKVAFSNVCCIHRRTSDSSALVVRVANATSSTHLDQDVIMDATFSMELFIVDEKPKGVLRRHKLLLQQSEFIFFRLAIELVHVIDRASPLYGIPISSNCMILVTISGVESNRHATIVNQVKYTHEMIRDGFYFEPMMDRDRVQNQLTIDFERLSAVVPSDYATTDTVHISEEEHSWSNREEGHLGLIEEEASEIIMPPPFVESGMDSLLFKKSASNRTVGNLSDGGSYLHLDDSVDYTYYHILHLRWWSIVAVIILLSGICTVLFALLHWIQFGHKFYIVTDMDRSMTPFELCLFLSLHTFSTIGYGTVGPAPGDRYHNALVAVEAMIGLVISSVLTGIFWSKFALPQAHIRFSSKILVTTYQGHRCLVFRAINTRSIGDIQMCHFKLGAFLTDSNGARRLHDLPLVQPHWPSINAPVTLIHIIDSSSPLRRCQDFSMSMLALFSGFDTTFCETVYARHLYSTYEFDKPVVDAAHLSQSQLVFDWRQLDM